jgi:hypothetical protein
VVLKSCIVGIIIPSILVGLIIEECQSIGLQSTQQFDNAATSPPQSPRITAAQQRICALLPQRPGYDAGQDTGP